MELVHALRALRGILHRELLRYLQQKTRFFSALVRPLLWLVVFGTGFRHALELSATQPSSISYQEYLIPGLIAMIFLFNGMQSSLSMVYDREIGVMRLLVTAPLPRWYLILGKLIASTSVSVLQAYFFLVICLVLGYWTPLFGLIIVFPFFILSGLLLASVGLVLSLYVNQIENFAGAMNFVIFPMFFLSSALYPLTQFQLNSEFMYWLAMINPLTHVVELFRHALYARFDGLAFIIVAAYTGLFTVIGIKGYAVAGLQRKIVQAKKVPTVKVLSAKS